MAVGLLASVLRVYYSFNLMSALFIAARMNGMNRTIQEIVHCVKICGSTLRKRLDEFSSTESAGLTVDSFAKVWLESSRDPPCFLPPTVKMTTHTAAEVLKRKEGNLAEADSSDMSAKEGEMMEFDDVEMHTALKDVHLVRITKQLDASDVGDADLSALDDDWEVANACITADEARFKSEMWESLNFEYTEKQKCMCILLSRKLTHIFSQEAEWEWRCRRRRKRLGCGQEQATQKAANPTSSRTLCL